MNEVTSQRIGKVHNAIERLPAEPHKHIYWIVYNEDMIEYTRDMIATIKGQEYLDKYVTVVSKTDPSKERTTGTVYFDPGLMDLLGNGR